MSTMTPSQTDLVRVRYRDFVARHEVAWELGFAALAVFFVALAFVPFEEGSHRRVDVSLEWIITGSFIAEFASRLWAAETRRAYVRGHWIDLFSCIPPTRWFRMFRLLRLLRLVRAFAGVGRAMTHPQRLANHKGLIWLFVAWIGVMFLCAVGLTSPRPGSTRRSESIRRPLVGTDDDDHRRIRGCLSGHPEGRLRRGR